MVAGFHSPPVLSSVRVTWPKPSCALFSFAFFWCAFSDVFFLDVLPQLRRGQSHHGGSIANLVEVVKKCTLSRN